LAFTTINFAYFFVLTTTVSWSLRRYRTYQKVFLLLASYYFYARWDLKLSTLLAGASLFDWAMSRAISRVTHPGHRRALLVTAVGANVALLAVFKLYDFFRASVASFGDFLGLSAHLPVLEIILPVGISFYTFQGIAYLVDVYRRDAFEARSLLDFLLFMAFFPQLLAGPICRSHELLPQFSTPAPAAIFEPSRAVVLIASGVFKKMVLATVLATRLVDDAFQMPVNYGSLELWVATYAYTAQVYLDFSGYTDLARGLALLLGFRIPENFDYPYRSTNIGDFWKRWHITFSRWLRDYVYFPLGGSRGASWRTYVNLVLTFLLCGIWHGSKWTFLVWGLAHGVALAAYKMSLDIRRARGVDANAPPSALRSVAGWFATIHFCALARIFFKSSDLETAGEFFTGLVSGPPWRHSFDVTVVLVTIMCFAMNFVGLPFFDLLVRWHARLPAVVRPLAWVGVGAALLAIKTREVAPYIYFGF
jgi:D-alanyl-lipoteichoic acid acyltransferase DltB (MBOAT superfamily)